MRSRDGNLLHGAHIIGFFRRICKLLFYGILPVFVFDGATPALKRQTIASRRHRRATVEQSLRKTAERILSLQLQKRALIVSLANQPTAIETTENSDRPIQYYDAASNRNIPANKNSERGLKRLRDEFELPLADQSTLKSVSKNDERLATEEELRSFIAFHRNDIDLSKINIDSTEFKNLPVEIQHEVIIEIKNRARAPDNSRVQSMLQTSKTSLDFSKLQIRNLVHRNALTQRTTLFAQNAGVVKSKASIDQATGGDSWKRKRHFGRRRIAGVRNRDFMLVKNEVADLPTNNNSAASISGDSALRDIAGYTMTVREVDLRVVDGTTGMQGFATSSIDDLTQHDPRIIRSSAGDDNVTAQSKDHTYRETPVLNALDQNHHQWSFQNNNSTPSDQPLINNFEAYVSDDQTVEQVLAKFTDSERIDLTLDDWHAENSNSGLIEYPYKSSEGLQMGDCDLMDSNSLLARYNNRTSASKPFPAHASHQSFISEWEDVACSAYTNPDAESMSAESWSNNNDFEFAQTSVVPVASAVSFDTRVIHDAKDDTFTRNAAIHLDTSEKASCHCLYDPTASSTSSLYSTSMNAIETNFSMSISPMEVPEQADQNSIVHSSTCLKSSNNLYKARPINCQPDSEYAQALFEDVLRLERTEPSDDNEFISCWCSIAPPILLSPDSIAPENSWFSPAILKVDDLELSRLFSIVIKRREKTELGSDRDISCRFLEQYLKQVRVRLLKRLEQTFPDTSRNAAYLDTDCLIQKTLTVPNLDDAPLSTVLDELGTDSTGDDFKPVSVSDVNVQSTTLTTDRSETKIGTEINIPHPLFTAQLSAAMPTSLSKNISEFLQFDDEDDEDKCVDASSVHSTNYLTHNPIAFDMTKERLDAQADLVLDSESHNEQLFTAALPIENDADDDEENSVEWEIVESKNDVSKELSVDVPDACSSPPLSESEIPTDECVQTATDFDQQLHLIKQQLQKLQQEGVDGDSAIDVPTQLEDEMQGYQEYFPTVDLTSPIDLNLKDVEQELTELEQQQRRGLRDASDITASMIAETQELLKQFGIPYIVATTEAESQCAFLQKQGLVEGIVTDDSDVFVFGGEVVYKNMFTQTRSVEIYTMDRLQEQLGLSREKLILLAYLLGSDYTPGLVGIGPVTSVEILNEWCNLDYSKGGVDANLEPTSALTGLEAFKAWVKRVGSGILDKEDSPTRKKLRNLAKKLDIPDGFPDLRVLNAYINPVVDQDLTNFTWGEPDLEGIRHFLEHKLQWSHETVDQTLVPVIKQMHQQKHSNHSTRVELNQTDITQYFPSEHTAHKSVRVQSVLDDWASRNTNGSKHSNSSSSKSKNSDRLPNSRRRAGRGRRGKARERESNQQG
ncbi:DNA repair protein rad2 [Batrachochytrium dendrobatidis]|nr:DNA repair protein rad2 [Batrachochytrium dendrobatidis]